jgi:hypothetical protein
MGRIYAGILGPLAFATTIARSLFAGGEAGQTLYTASFSLFGFAALGYIIGSVAERTIVEAIGNRFQAQWMARDGAGRPGHSTEASSSASDAHA